MRYCELWKMNHLGSKVLISQSKLCVIVKRVQELRVVMSYKKSREKTISEELIETSIYSKDKEFSLFDGPD